jgi:hypothetical protein
VIVRAAFPAPPGTFGAANASASIAPHGPAAGPIRPDSSPYLVNIACNRGAIAFPARKGKGAVVQLLEVASIGMCNAFEAGRPIKRPQGPRPFRGRGPALALSSVNHADTIFRRFSAVSAEKSTLSRKNFRGFPVTS